MDANPVISSSTAVDGGSTSRKKHKRKLWASALFLLPAWLLLLIFFIGPILLTFYFAFTNLSLTGSEAQSTQFVGFSNFLNMFQDPNFRISVMKTVVYLLFSAIIGQQVLGFILALLMKEKILHFGV